MRVLQHDRCVGKPVFRVQLCGPDLHAGPGSARELVGLLGCFQDKEPADLQQRAAGQFGRQRPPEVLRGHAALPPVPAAPGGASRVQPAAVHLRAVQLRAAAHAGQHQRGALPGHRLPLSDRPEEGAGASLDLLYLGMWICLGRSLFGSFQRGALLPALPPLHQRARRGASAVSGPIWSLRAGAGVGAVTHDHRRPLCADIQSCKTASQESQSWSAAASGGVRGHLEHGERAPRSSEDDLGAAVKVSALRAHRQPTASAPDGALCGRL